MNDLKYKIIPSHVAILVPSVDKAAQYLQNFNFQFGPKEEFEITREIYVHMEKSNSLLLMEPKGPGSYQRALEKRGPGIHHFAIDVLDVNSYLHSIRNSGWFLHLNSLSALKNYQTAYLARPGFPALIEVQEKEQLSDSPLFVEKITLPLDSRQKELVRVIGLESVVVPGTNCMITLAGNNIELKELLK